MDGFAQCGRPLESGFTRQKLRRLISSNEDRAELSCDETVLIVLLLNHLNQVLPLSEQGPGVSPSPQRAVARPLGNEDERGNPAAFGRFAGLQTAVDGCVETECATVPGRGVVCLT